MCLVDRLLIHVTVALGRGGEIELFILSQHFRVEIVAIEIRSLHCYSYGRAVSCRRLSHGPGWKETCSY